MLQAKTNPQFGSAGPDESIDDTSLFLTAEFQGSVTSLANIDSLSLLLDTIGRTLGMNKAMDDNPYVRILFNSAKATKYTPGDPNLSAANDFVNLWHAEVLHRTLLQVVPKDIADPTLLRNLVSDFTSKLRNTQKHNNSYSIYSEKFISYMQTTLSHTFAYDDAKFHSQFNVHTITSNSVHTLECMSSYFSRVGNEKLRMLLSFFGATYDAKSGSGDSSEILSSTVLKNTLECGLELDHICAGVTSQNANEIRYRKAISDALFSEITSIHSKIEDVESSLHKQCKWYHFIRKIYRFFLSKFTIHKLYNSFETMKNLDGIFRNSIAFGDCAAFFLELSKVEKTSKNAYTSPLFKTLNKLQKTYKPVTHSEYVSSVKNCFMSSTPTQVFPLSAGRTSGLHNIKNNIKKVGISSACTRTSVRVHGLLNRILSPNNSEKPSPDAIVSHSSPLFGATQFSELGLLSHKGTSQHSDKKNRGKHSSSGRLHACGVRLISEAVHKKAHFLSSVSKALHIKNKKATGTDPTEDRTNSAANDLPSGELLATGVRSISEVAHKKVHLLPSAPKVLKKYKKATRTIHKALKIKCKGTTGTDSTEDITNSAANDLPSDELLAASASPISEVAHKKVRLLSHASKALKIKYKKAKRTARKALHIKNKKAIGTASIEDITNSAASDLPSDQLLATSVSPISEVAHKKVRLLSHASKALKIKYKKAKRTARKALHIKNKKAIGTASIEDITQSAANDLPSSDLLAISVSPISEVTHKNLLSSVSKALKIRYKKAKSTAHKALKIKDKKSTGIGSTEVITQSAANDSPDAELLTAEDITHSATNDSPGDELLTAEDITNSAANDSPGDELLTREAVTHQVANDLPGGELLSTSVRPISEIPHKKGHLLSSVSKALHIKNKKVKHTASTEAVTHSAANDLPGGVLSTSVRPISEIPHKKGLLSSVSKALHIKNKKAKHTASTEAVTHSAANDLPSSELRVSDMRSMTGGRKAPFSSR